MIRYWIEETGLKPRGPAERLETGNLGGGGGSRMYQRPGR
jgi:hypothetical protein